jgi:hypothetical protein
MSVGMMEDEKSHAKQKASCPVLWCRYEQIGSKNQNKPDRLKDGYCPVCQRIIEPCNKEEDDWPGYRRQMREPAIEEDHY